MADMTRRVVKSGKKEVTVRLIMDELLYDIMNETYLRGRTLLDDKNYKKVASMYASLDADNRDKVMRSVKRACSEVRGEASEYLDQVCVAADNGLGDDGDFVLRLVMPGNYDEASVSALVEAVHDYVVCRVVGDWYLVTNKEDAEGYALLARGATESVRVLLGRRRRPSRPL